MRQARLILLKDVRHLWPQISLVLTIVALDGWLDAATTGEFPFQPVLLGLWAISCAYLAASAVQQESLAGHNQYWLTRPISRSSLLLAKLGFLVLFAAAPRVIAGALALALNGVSPLRHAPVLLANGFFCLTVALATAALAALTEDLVQLLWLLLPVAALEIISLIRGGRDANQANVAWIGASVLAIIVLTAAFAILIVQYLRRRRFVSAGILASAGAIVAFAPSLASWHAAFALQSRLSRSVEPAALILRKPQGRTGRRALQCR